MQQSIKLPTFLVIGVQKAGTTSIYNYLKQHPQVYMSPVKETNFLLKDWEEIRKSKVLEKKKKRIDTFEDYCQLFEDVKDEVAIGEVSPNYLFNYQTSVECILRYVPQAKLIAILRNPIERAYSDHLMHLRDAIGYISLSEQIKFSSHKSFTILKGFYYSAIKYYFEKFDRKQIKVYLYDDLCKSTVNFMQDIYQFIEVDPTFVPDVSRKAQIAQVPKNRWLNTLLIKQNPIRSFANSVVRSVLPVQTRKEIRSTLIKLNSKAKEEVTFQPEERQQLLELYREDILKVQDLIERDLSSWLSV